MLKKKKIIIAMSGGVDSSVAAKLLVDDGYDVLGIFLSFWKDAKAMNVENKCCSAKALTDARAVCTQIGIKLYVLDFSEVFKKEIVDNFLSEYDIGNTPNPCVRCNKFVKLGLLIKKAKTLGYDKVATGHYARVIKERVFLENKKKTKYKLLKGVDEKKDQSYYLYKFGQKELSHLVFPLGGFTKQEVRRMALKYNLPVATKTESQEICFVPDDHNTFLKNYLKLVPGQIKDLSEKVLGAHQGLPLYTIGQRKGIEIGGVGPFYVVRKDAVQNVLFVTNNPLDSELFKKNVVVCDLNWIKYGCDSFVLCEAVIRYGAKPVVCKVSNIKKELNKCFVSFSKPQRAITSGQSIVFYEKDELLGGGIIE